MKWMVRLLVVLVVVFALVAVIGNRWVSHWAVETIEDATGFGVSVDKIHVGLLSSVVEIDNLILSNPSEFPDPEAITVHEVYVHYDLLSLLGDRPRFKEIRLDVPRVVMVRPEQGPSNVQVLTQALGKKEDKMKGGKPEPGPAGEEQGGRKEPEAKKPPVAVRIDELTVRFGEMEVRSYAKGQAEPTVLHVPVQMDRTYQNVTNLESVAIQLSSELVLRSGVGLLSQMDAVINKVDGKSGKVAERLNKALKGVQEHFLKKSE